MPSKTVTLPACDFSGSWLRCLLLTHRSRDVVAQLLTEMVEPLAVVNADDAWMPHGFKKPEEAKLGETSTFLSGDHRKILTDWWLKVPRNANTPNWDIVSTCTIEGQRGLILVEAKAHSAELKKEGKGAGNQKNDLSIRAAVRQSNEALNQLTAGWNLTAESHYQLCNRFAWSWKIAALGVPVILLYLGFLNADEMAGQGQPFHAAKDWEDLIRGHAKGIVPDALWGQRLKTSGAPMYPLIRAVDLRWAVAST